MPHKIVEQVNALHALIYFLDKRQLANILETYETKWRLKPDPEIAYQIAVLKAIERLRRIPLMEDVTLPDWWK